MGFIHSLLCSLVSGDAACLFFNPREIFLSRAVSPTSASPFSRLLLSHIHNTCDTLAAQCPRLSAASLMWVTFALLAAAYRAVVLRLNMTLVTLIFLYPVLAVNTMNESQHTAHIKARHMAAPALVSFITHNRTIHRSFCRVRMICSELNMLLFMVLHILQ